MALRSHSPELRVLFEAGTLTRRISSPTRQLKGGRRTLGYGRFAAWLSRGRRSLRLPQRLSTFPPARSNYLPALEGAAQIEYQRGSDKAKPLLGRILDTDPANTTAHAMLAMIALKAHDCPEAVRHFRRATPAINSQPSALNAYGYCLANLSRFEEAIPILAQVVALNQNESPATISL